MPGEHILVAIDAPTLDQPVLERALELARARSALLTVVHVVEDMPPGMEDVVGREDLDATREHALQEARGQIDAIVAACDPGRADWNSRIESGSPSARIRGVAEEIAADLIVLGAGRARTLAGKFLGSTADRVIRSVSAPVLVVRRSADGPYRKVVAALDLSFATDAVVDAVDRLCRDADLRLVHVVQVLPTFEQAMLRVGAGKEKLMEYRRIILGGARTSLRRIARRLTGRGRPPHISILEGNAARTLSRLARRRDIDLIVAGPHGHGFLRRALLGSVAQRLLREAACDVLIARRTN